jgi:hypothetical protein
MLLPAALVLNLACRNPICAQNRPAAEPKRGAHVVQYNAARDIAEILPKPTEGSGRIHAGPEGTSNCLVGNMPPAVFAEIMKDLERLERLLDGLTGIVQRLDNVVTSLEQLDRRPQFKPQPHSVTVEVFVVELPAKKANDTGTGPDEKDFSDTIASVTKRLDVLMRQGQVAGFKRIRLTSLEGQLGSLMVGETKPFVTATSVTGSGLITKQITYRNIGTQVKVTPQVATDGSVTLALDVQDSRSRDSATATVGKDEKGMLIFAAEFIETSLRGKIRVASGKAVLARDTVVTSKAGQGEMLIIVGARVAAVEATAK